MNIITTVLLGILVLYACFVTFNTYIYHEKQSEEARNAIQIQWGF